VSTIAKLENDLPWGLHDAYVESMAIDWPRARLVMDMRLMISEHQDEDQRARITITGLVYCAIEPPTIKPPEYEPCPEDGLWVQPDEMSAAPEGHPTTPEGCFVHRFFVSDWNSCFYIVGKSAELAWLEAEPKAARAGSRAYFEGEEIPVK
jgi:hypothetical protein